MWKSVIRDRALRFVSGGTEVTISPARLGVLVAVGVVAVLAVLFGYRALNRGTWNVTIATSTPRGTYYPVSQQLARILNEISGGAIDTRVDTACASSLATSDKRPPIAQRPLSVLRARLVASSC